MQPTSDREVWHLVMTPDDRVIWLGWGIGKNKVLMLNPDRNVSFEQVLLSIAENGIKDLYEHPGRADQWMLEVTIDDYTYVCPCKLIDGKMMSQYSSLKPATQAEKRAAAKVGVVLQPDYLDADEADAIEAFKAGEFVKVSKAKLDKLFPRKHAASS